VLVGLRQLGKSACQFLQLFATTEKSRKRRKEAMTLAQRTATINDIEVKVLEWSGKREDEAELREFCGERLQYVRDDGVAAIGEKPLTTDSFVEAGDLLVKPVEAEGQLLRLPGDIHWVQVIFGA
jgi:hypothetical protein